MYDPNWSAISKFLETFRFELYRKWYKIIWWIFNPYQELKIMNKINNLIQLIFIANF